MVWPVVRECAACGVVPTEELTSCVCCSFTGINAEQSAALVEKAHIYLTQNGRISMAGLNTRNIRYFAENLDKVVRGEL